MPPNAPPNRPATAVILSPEQALQHAVIAQLRADPALALLLEGRVYDHTPAQATYPMAVYGRSQSRPWGGAGGGTGGGTGGATDGAGMEQAVSLTVVSRLQGLEEVRAAGGLVRAALDDAPLTLEDHRLVSLFVTFLDAFHAPDWRTTFAVVRLRAVTEPL